MAGMNAAATGTQNIVPRRMATGAAPTGTSVGSGGPGASISRDGVTFGGGLTSDMQNMNQLRAMAGRIPSFGQMERNRHSKAQGECVRESGKSADDIKSMDPMGQEFRSFQSNMHLCADAKILIQDNAREQYIKDNGGSAVLHQKIHDLMMK